MTYVKTEWENGTTPINADNLNKIENELESLDTSNTYSTTETAVGTWTDGKTIYRKVITRTTALPSGSTNIAHGITNLNMITNFRANYYTATGSVRSDQYTNNNYNVFVNNIGDTNVTINVGTGYNNSFTKTIIVLEYTKST